MKSEYFVLKRGDNITVDGKIYKVNDIEHIYDGLSLKAISTTTEGVDSVIHIKSSYNDVKRVERHTFRKSDIESIMNDVCEYFVLSKSELTSKSRSRHVVLARTVCTMLMDDMGIHNVIIGRMLNTDRTNVIYFLKKKEDLKLKDRDAHNAYENIKRFKYEKREKV